MCEIWRVYSASHDKLLNYNFHFTSREKYKIYPCLTVVGLTPNPLKRNYRRLQKSYLIVRKNGKPLKKICKQYFFIYHITYCSRISVAQTLSNHEKMFEAGVVRANEC